MRVTIEPGPRTGRIEAPVSKSQAHRLLILAAFSEAPVHIGLRGTCEDIEATVRCLRALGADITEEPEGLYLRPVADPPEGEVELPCGESGSTLRFLLPVAGALGVRAFFRMEGRLPARPLEPLAGVLRDHGMEIFREGSLLHCRGQLRPGAYSIPGSVSSQYISGLLMALPLLPAESTLEVTGEIQSADYIRMTEDAAARGGLVFEKTGNSYKIAGGRSFRFPERVRAEGDWSGAAFFLCMGALSEQGVTVRGLSEDSLQGDRAVLDILEEMGAVIRRGSREITVKRGDLRGVTIDAAPVPDLIPVLSAVAAAARGETRIVHAERLRLKESDRIKTTCEMLSSLGARVTELSDGLTILGQEKLAGGTSDSFADHRIAMAAAVAAGASSDPVTVLNAECTAKSYPEFWEDLKSLKTLQGRKGLSL